MQLDQPDLDHERKTVTSKRNTVKVRLDRLAADRDDLNDKLVLESELVALSSRLAGLELERDELAIKAPQSGIVAELNATLNVGRWIAVKDQIALIAGPGRPSVTGYLSEDGLSKNRTSSSNSLTSNLRYVCSETALAKPSSVVWYRQSERTSNVA